MLHGFVRWEHRWSPAAALECKFLHPEAMALAGRPADIPPSSLAKGLAGEASHKGSRHAWSIVAGCIAPDVLDWLRAEPALQMDSEAWKELGGHLPRPRDRIGQRHLVILARAAGVPGIGGRVRGVGKGWNRAFASAWVKRGVGSSGEDGLQDRVWAEVHHIR